MAGSFEVGPGRTWMVSGWLFDDTLLVLADILGPGAVSESMRDIVKDNLGMFSMSDWPPADRARIRDACASLHDRAEATFFPFEGRDSALRKIDELVEMVRTGESAGGRD